MELPYSLSENFISTEQQSELLEIRKEFNHLLKSTDNECITLHILNNVYPETDNLATLLEQITDLKKCLDSFQPFNQVQIDQLNEALDTEYTYESNGIEGNMLTLVETNLIVNKGIVISGKSMKEHLEAINHYEAVHFIRKIAGKGIKFDENVLLQIHAIILTAIDRQNAGLYRSVNVRISGSQHICPNPVKVPELMQAYFAYYEKNKNIIHPVELSAHMHEKLVSVHPFIDGNGRTARLIMNLILLKNGYPITIISSERNKRQHYYLTLENSHIEQDNLQFRLLIADYVKQSLFNYLDMFSANLNEDEKGYYFFKRIEPFLN